MKKWGKTEETGTFISDLDEGELTEIKKQLVQKNTLADAIDNLGIAYYLIMGKGDVEKNIQDSLSVKEDLFEAILGAIALDSNWDIEALQEGHLKGVVLDVFETEPLPETSPLWNMENILITPHIAGPSFGGNAEVQDMIWNICMENLERYVNGKELKNIVRLKDGY